MKLVIQNNMYCYQHDYWTLASLMTVMLLDLCVSCQYCFFFMDYVMLFPPFVNKTIVSVSFIVLYQLISGS